GTGCRAAAGTTRAGGAAARPGSGGGGGLRGAPAARGATVARYAAGGGRGIRRTSGTAARGGRVPRGPRRRGRCRRRRRRGADGRLVRHAQDAGTARHPEHGPQQAARDDEAAADHQCLAGTSPSRGAVRVARVERRAETGAEAVIRAGALLERANTRAGVIGGTGVADGRRGTPAESQRTAKTGLIIVEAR